MSKDTATLISIVMPCLNEEASVATCVSWAWKGLRRLQSRGYRGEVIVVDNGSSDRSAALAREAGATVIVEERRGYGRAYLKGISASHGAYIVIGDSDGTYDFRAMSPFITKLEHGADLVLGSRLKGLILPGSMPFTHRYIGTPILTAILNVTYGTRVSDAQTGFRAMTKKAYEKMHLQSTGMELASEMIVKAAYHHLRIEEIPIVYHRRLGQSKLLLLPDAWRHIKFLLLYAPTFVLLVPGVVLFVIGEVVSLLLLPKGIIIRGRLFDIHTMTIGVLVANLGVQVMLLGIFARIFTQKILGLPGGPLGRYVLSKLSVENLFALGLVFFSVGFIFLARVTLVWIQSGYGELFRIREIIYGMGLVIIGAQLFFSSFLFGLLDSS